MIVYPKQRKTDMDKIEKIRQEIERRKVQYYEREMKAWDDNGEYGDEDCYFYQGKRKACEGLLCFLDTLSEEPDKSLEEAAEKYLDGVFGKGKHQDFYVQLFIAGAKWQKEQMLKDAEPAEIGYFNQRGLSILTEKAIERMPVSEGDKVRIIIVKED